MVDPWAGQLAGLKVVSRAALLVASSVASKAVKMVAQMAVPLAGLLVVE